MNAGDIASMSINYLVGLGDWKIDKHKKDLILSQTYCPQDQVCVGFFIPKSALNMGLIDFGDKYLSQAIAALVAQVPENMKFTDRALGNPRGCDSSIAVLSGVAVRAVVDEYPSSEDVPDDWTWVGKWYDIGTDVDESKKLGLTVRLDVRLEPRPYDA